MRIGILTFHRPINYGAFLQAYSLSNKLINCFPNSKVEIIDYISPKERKNIFLNILKDIKRAGLVGGLRSLKKNQAFRKSYKILVLSNKKMCTNNLNELYDYIEANYDCLILGSDAIFNWKQTGFPTPFIPYKKLKIPVLTYAASVHGMRYLEEDGQRLKKCSQAFKNISFIGVRDVCSENFVKYCEPSVNPLHCCDPTLFINKKTLIEEAGDYKKRIYKKYKISLDEKYIVIMCPDNKLVSELIKKYGSEYNIIHVFEGDKKDKLFLYDLTPFEWTQVLSKAALVITRFFHGALLSLIHNTPTFVVDYSNYKDEYESKLRDLMVRRLNLSKLYCDCEQANSDFFSTVFLKETVNDLLNGTYNESIEKGINDEAESFKTFEVFLTKLVKNKI